MTLHHKSWTSVYIYFEDTEPEWRQALGDQLPRAGKYLCRLQGVTDDVQSVGVYRFRYRKRCFVDMVTEKPVMVTHWCTNRGVG